MLKQCTNLNYLHLFDFHYQTDAQHEIPDPNSWMRQKYPKLEFLGLSSVPSIDDLETFFQNNLNVRRFLTSAEIIWKHRHRFKNFNLQLDVLKVCGKVPINLFMPFCKLLNELYEIKFHRRLEMYGFFRGVDLTTINDFSVNLASLNGLELYLIEYEKDLRFLPDLFNLKELTVWLGRSSLESKLIPKKFANLQKLYFFYADDETINMLIKGLPKLKILALEFISTENNILKLRTLNMERQKVFETQNINTSKVTIYVSDDIFLKTKWSIANGDTNLQMIEMKRIASYNRDYIHL